MKQIFTGGIREKMWIIGREAARGGVFLIGSDCCLLLQEYLLLLLQILFQRKLFGESAVRFRNIGLGVTVALIPFDGGSVAGANELSGRELLKLLLDGTEFLPVAVAGSEDL